MKLEHSVAGLAVGMTIITIALTFTIYFVANTNYNYLSSQQSSFSNALQEESTAISNLVQQESTYSKLIQQQSSAVNSLQQTVSNFNQAQSSVHRGAFMNATLKPVTYAGASSQMYVANVTGYTTLYVYLSDWSTTGFGIYFSQSQDGRYFNTYCAGETPNTCNSGNGNSIVTVVVQGNFVGLTGMSGGVTYVTIYAVK